MSMPVSGPGALSQRTDQQTPMSVTGLPYGDGQALMAQQQGAPMAASPPPATPQPISMSAPSQRPGEPVTHGADAGPGANSSILTALPGAPAATGAISSAISVAAASDTSGVLQQLLLAAQQRGL